MATNSATAVKEEVPTEEVTTEGSYIAPSDPTPDQDVERLLPGPGEPITLESGKQVLVNPLRLREFLAMLKIITRGAAMALGSVRLDTNDEDFMQNMLSLFVFAIPEAEDEVVDFVRVMVSPYGNFSGSEKVEAVNQLWEEMANPELEDLFTVVEVVIHREGSDLRRLGKRLANAIAFARKTGQV